MALPRSGQTERLLHLSSIVEKTDPEELLKWAHPRADELVAFARIIMLFSALDFTLRFVAEIMDEQKLLPPPWTGRVHKLRIVQTSEAIQSWQLWPQQNKVAFGLIEEHRRVRNLLAHFIVRRIPTEDGYIFMTKSASDFKQVYGTAPTIDKFLYGVADGSQLRGIIPELQHLLKWCSKLPASLKPLTYKLEP